MKAKTIIKIIITILLMILAVSLIIAAYYLLIDIESKAPEEIESSCKIKTEEYMDRKIFVITPKENTANNKTILYFHGGSYVAEASNEHWKFVEKLVNETGDTVIMPDYPLTPKYNYKDVFRMVVPLYKEIIERINTEDLMLMGDSAGGGLSLALCEKIKEENIEQPGQTILISPWLDVRLNNEKIAEIEPYDKELNKEKLKLAGIAYAGEDGINSYLVNPIDGNLRGMKNITIYTGTNDILNPDVHKLEEKAKEVETIIDVKEYKDKGHIWLIKECNVEELKKIL